MTSAWASTRTDSIRVRADDTGLPVEVRIEPGELRYGGAELARTVLDLTLRASTMARALRRIELERDGMDPDMLDRMGFPSTDAVAVAENEAMDREAGPTSWLRSV
jgi:hypothetical protein